MAKKSIKKNYIYNMIYQVLMVFAPLVTTPYISRVLGSAGVGTVSYAESVTSYFVLFASMGIATYGQREISYCQDLVEERSRVFWNTKLAGFIISGITLLVYVIFSLINHNAVYLALSANILVVFFDITWFFYGIEEFGIIIFRNVIIKILQIVYYFIFVRTPEDVVIYALGIGLFTVVGNISLWPRLRKYIVRVPLKELNPFENYGVIISLFIPTIAIQIYTVLDKTMIGKITNDAAQNGYYEQATKLCKVVLTIITSLATVMIPRIGAYFKQNNKSAIRDLMYTSYRFVLFLGIPLCFGLIGISDNLVPWFLGSGFMGAIPIMKIQSLLIIAIGINTVTGNQFMIPTGRQNTYTKTVIIGAVTNFCLNMVLISVLQAIGAAIASVVAETTIAIVQLIYVKKDISMVTIIKNGKNYIIAGLLMCLMLLEVGKMLTSSIMNTLIMVILGAICYFLILLFLRDKFLLEQAKGIIGKVKNKR